MTRVELNLSEFSERCIFNFEYDCQTDGAYHKAVDRVLVASADTDEFIDSFIATEELQPTQACAVLAEKHRPEKKWYILRHILGDRVFKTVSDAGGVKVGNAGFSVVISNGHGDGETRCAIVDEMDCLNDYMSFSTVIEGNDINIFGYDCGNEVIKHLSGRYGVYAWQGFVVFEKWN